jgi:hypothetical protein
LRLWKPGDSDAGGGSSRIHHFRRLLVSHDPEKTENTVFRWPLLTLDPQANIRFPRQQLQPRLRKCAEAESLALGDLDHRWEASFDFRNVPAGDRVDLIVEYQSAGLFLQHGDDSITVPLNVRGATAEITVWILMPEGRQCTDFHVIRYRKTGRRKVEAVKPDTVYMATDSTILAFTLLSLDSGYNYEVSWNYR